MICRAQERKLYIRQLPYIVSGKSRSQLFPSYQLTFASLLLFIQRTAYCTIRTLPFLRLPVKKRERQAGVVSLPTGYVTNSHFQLSLAFRRIKDDTKSDKYNGINNETLKLALNLGLSGPIPSSYVFQHLLLALCQR